MSSPVVTFFNNKGGVGKTSLVYHLAWMYAEMGVRVIAADLDPQANLTAAFLDDDRLEALWTQNGQGQTVYDCVAPLVKGTGDIAVSHIEQIADNLGLVVGDLKLSGFEDELSAQWPSCVDGKERAFRVTSAFWRILLRAASDWEASVVLVDVGPNLGALNRAAMVATDYVIVPLSPDLFSLQGLRNLGPTLRRWRSEWDGRCEKLPIASGLVCPEGQMRPAGYIVLQHAVRLDRPVKAYNRWVQRIPGDYQRMVLDLRGPYDKTVDSDPECLALLKHYRSLMPMAQEARKPMFHLKPADGAIGAHWNAVQAVFSDFERLARAIAARTGIRL